MSLSAHRRAPCRSWELAACPACPCAGRQTLLPHLWLKSWALSSRPQRTNGTGASGAAVDPSGLAGEICLPSRVRAYVRLIPALQLQERKRRPFAFDEIPSQLQAATSMIRLVSRKVINGLTRTTPRVQPANIPSAALPA